MAAMVGRILRTADFERALAQAPRSRSAHFAAHHVAAGPSAPKGRAIKPAAENLSTGDAPNCQPPVDDLSTELPTGWWLGMVVPKRHARRSVTRNLIKRQMRERMAEAVRQASAEGSSEGHEAGHRLPPGLWVLRLRGPFDPRQFNSPSSIPLKIATRGELDALLGAAAAAPAPGARRPPAARASAGRGGARRGGGANARRAPPAT